MLSVCQLTVSVWRVPFVAPHALLLQLYHPLLPLLWPSKTCTFFLIVLCTVALPSSSVPSDLLPAPRASRCMSFPPPPRALNSHLEVESCRAVFMPRSALPPPLPFIMPLPLWPNVTWPDPQHAHQLNVWPDLILWHITHSCPTLKTHTQFMTRLDPTPTHRSSLLWLWDLPDLWPDLKLANQVASHSPSTSRFFSTVKSSQPSYLSDSQNSLSP